ncbi:MAG: helix-turn-helix domain-containing protein [Oscillospiraceae bacterium]
MQTNTEFDLKLATECAAAFAASSDLGCVVSDTAGKVLFEAGYGCASCGMCLAAGQIKDNCVRSHIYGMTEAERFGGKYIYFCPMGLTCFVSPILGSERSAAKITVGPFLMVDRQDYISCDLVERLQLKVPLLVTAADELKNVPVVETEKVNRLSTLLFMAVGFMNNVSAANRMLDTQESDAVRGQITSYIMKLKGEDEVPPYPFETERALLRSISQSNKPEAQRLLNELFGHIFFSSGGNFEQAKSRVYELLVLISRAAIDAGAEPDGTLSQSHRYMQALHRQKNIDDLCFWLKGVMDSFMDNVFEFMDVRHLNMIHKTVQYMRAHYAEKITLNVMAEMAYLSPAYFSRVFKKETGRTFSSYLNLVRIEKSKEMLLHMDLRLTDIALMTGFEDQSYFTKVFKRVTGLAPLKYRESKGVFKTTK